MSLEWIYTSLLYQKSASISIAVLAPTACLNHQLYKYMNSWYLRTVSKLPCDCCQRSFLGFFFSLAYAHCFPEAADGAVCILLQNMAISYMFVIKNILLNSLLVTKFSPDVVTLIVGNWNGHWISHCQFLFFQKITKRQKFRYWRFGTHECV